MSETTGDARDTAAQTAAGSLSIPDRPGSAGGLWRYRCHGRDAPEIPGTSTQRTLTPNSGATPVCPVHVEHPLRCDHRRNLKYSKDRI